MQYTKQLDIAILALFIINFSAFFYYKYNLLGSSSSQARTQLVNAAVAIHSQQQAEYAAVLWNNIVGVIAFGAQSFIMAALLVAYLSTRKKEPNKDLNSMIGYGLCLTLAFYTLLLFYPSLNVI